MTPNKSTKKCAARKELTVCIGLFFIKRVHLLLICLDYFRFFIPHLALVRNPQCTFYTLRYCRYKNHDGTKQSTASRSIKC